ncbi:MAG: DUF434 domain-containing protein, partial [Spirochaetales bacterium]|nr:DUF434 domain-containing protein [Spirochaetales bacterium]
TIKLVGDRYRLPREGRVVLFRGVHGRDMSDRIFGRILHRLPPGSLLGLDGYNVLFTVANYRMGHPLFVGTDGLLRDAGGAHGRFPSRSVFCEALELVVSRLAELEPSRAAFFLDSPVSSSGDHAAAIRQACVEAGINATVTVAVSADPLVRDYVGDAVATADSAIVLAARVPVYDLARDVLERRFCVRFFELREVINK